MKKSDLLNAFYGGHFLYGDKNEKPGNSAGEFYESADLPFLSQHA